jgi:hypothetical protein
MAAFTASIAEAPLPVVEATVKVAPVGSVRAAVAALAVPVVTPAAAAVVTSAAVTPPPLTVIWPELLIDAATPFACIADSSDPVVALADVPMATWTVVTEL